MDQLDSLTPAQRNMLNDFTAITNTSDLENALTVLQASDWELQSAISSIYDQASTSRSPSSSRSRESRPLLDQFDIDDSAVGPPAGPAPPPGVFALVKQILSLPIAILTFPASVLYQTTSFIFAFIARILRLRPGTPSLRPRNPFTRQPRVYLSPSAAAERWVRSLHEVTGVSETGRSSSFAAAGPSNETRSRRSGSEGKNVVDFERDGYEEVVRRARDDKKVLMIVLTCEEHDDDLAFKRNVLCDQDLVETLRREQMLAWGGDIKQRDGHQVMKTLVPYSFPFIAFISLQSSSSASTSSPRMSIISRLEGSYTTALSASSIVTHLTTVVLPRVSPFLSRLKALEASRVTDRRIREDRERALEQAARQDEERILRVRAEEKARRESAEREAREAESREREQQQLESKREQAERWRSWRKQQLGAEKGEARIVVRLGDGRRVMRRFEPSQTVEDIYAWVECELSPPSTSVASSPPAGYSHNYEFKLVTTFPRSVIDVKDDRKLEAIGWAKGASVVVEGLEGRRVSLGERPNDDGEESEEEEEEE